MEGRQHQKDVRVAVVQVRSEQAQLQMSVAQVAQA
jgi:hypothetical protein